MTKAENPKLREERLREFLQEIKQELDCMVQPREIYAEIVRSYIVKVIELLRQGKGLEAREELGVALARLYQAKVQASPDDFYEAHYAFDLGFFAYCLESYSDDVKEIDRQIWHVREEFEPHLSEAIRAAYLFIAYLRNGVNPKLAYYYALKALNHMRMISYYSVHGFRPIGDVLGESALAKLKEILRAYVREHGKGS